MPTAQVSKLARFRMLVGIETTPASVWVFPGRPAPNTGLYQSVVHEELKTRIYFYIAASGINTCFLLQVAVAAALTALGASSGSHIAITALGAINTTIAGILTYLKGQGLPNRLEQYRNSLLKLKQHIDDLERDFRDGSKRDVLEEVEIIRQMYRTVMQTAQNNSPNTYVTAAAAPSTTPNGVPTVPQPQLSSAAAGGGPQGPTGGRPDGLSPTENGGVGPPGGRPDGPRPAEDRGVGPTSPPRIGN